MVKKIAFDPADFDKVVDYIIAMPVKFNQATKAVEINEILKRAQKIEVEFNDSEKSNSNN
jgi:hypothetical protein